MGVIADIMYSCGFGSIDGLWIRLDYMVSSAGVCCNTRSDMTGNCGDGVVG